MRRFEPAPDALFAAVPGGGVVLHTATKRYYSLNETGARIWALLEANGDPAEAGDALASEYAIPRTEAHAAVLALVERLSDAGLLLPARE